MEVNNRTTLEVHEGDAAFLQFERQEFLDDWDLLYQSCPWRTVFQSRQFVLTWYRLFSADYTPIILTTTEGGKVTGLLTLAKSKKKPIITGAGSRQAEYHAWLCDAARGAEFIRSALVTLRKKFPRFNILFTYLPPKAPVEWIKSENAWRNKCFMRVLKQPLVHVTRELFSKKLKGKTIREKIKRLQRLGSLKFERIADLETFTTVLDELIVQYEFRKGAMYNITPFREEPAKRTLLIELFKLNMVHVTVLKLDEKIIASAVNTVEHNWLCFKGLNAHAPHYSKQSPGLLHLLMLGSLLAEEGIETFDLTPGDDFYKDKLATHFEEVVELWITSSRSGYYKLTLTEGVKKAVREGLTRRGVDPRVVLARARKMLENIRLIKHHGLTSVQRVASGILSRRKKRVLLIEPGKPVNMKIPAIKKNNLADLLLYQASVPGMSRWDFLKDAMRRFELGEHCYSLVDNGRLLACAWLRGKYSEPVDSIGASLPPEAEIIHAVYSHPALKAWVEPFINAVAEAVTSDLQHRPTYLLADPANRTLASLGEPEKGLLKAGKGSYFQ